MYASFSLVLCHPTIIKYKYVASHKMMILSFSQS